MRISIRVLVAGVALIIPAVAAQTAVSASDLDSVVAAWSARQRQAATIQFDWHGTELLQSRTPKKEDRHSDTLKPFDLRYSVIWDQNKRVRIESFGSGFDDDSHQITPNHAVYTYDGRLINSLHPDTANALGNPMMSISLVKPSLALDQLCILPIKLVFRPFGDLRGQLSPAGLKIAPVEPMVDSHRCVELHESTGKSEAVVIWADPARGYVPLRYERIVRGATISHLEIGYDADAVIGWMPMRWKYVSLSESGESRYVQWGDVKSYRINPPVKDSDFTLPIPTRAWINDGRTHQAYILRADGTKRIIRPGEYNGKNFYELVDHDPATQR